MANLQPSIIPVSLAQTVKVSGKDILIPQLITPLGTITNVPTETGQMYSISPNLSEWKLSHDIGNITTDIRTFSIRNLTTNTPLLVSIQLPEFVIITRNNNFIVSENSTELFTLQFISETTLTDSINGTIIITILPVVNSSVQII